MLIELENARAYRRIFDYLTDALVPPVLLFTIPRAVVYVKVRTSLKPHAC